MGRTSHCCVEYLASRERCSEQRRRISNTAPAGANPLRASQYSTEHLQDRKAAVDFSGADDRGAEEWWMGLTATWRCRGCDDFGLRQEQLMCLSQGRGCLGSPTAGPWGMSWQTRMTSSHGKCIDP
ncbi:hypothetical protein E2C01_059018 [Portunus trituberculatus]|uniref:Uncharacterized protein n=1 Tax=Portunus trituberculatus TaxID=210409 RepID=A0A5B7H6A2_PORTR|nr:hypothetical protein [Portunus trituberculatus]